MALKITKARDRTRLPFGLRRRIAPCRRGAEKGMESFDDLSLTEGAESLCSRMGRSQFSRGQSNRCAAEEEMGGSVDDPAPDLK